MTEDKFKLVEDKLVVLDSQSTISFDLEIRQDAQLIVDKLNNYENFIHNFSRNVNEQKGRLQLQLDGEKGSNSQKKEAINTIKKSYELRSKVDDFNIQMIALIKLDCIKEIQRQYEAIKLRDKGDSINE